MVTRNFLNILAMALQAGSDKGGVPGRAVTGEFRYFNGGLSFLSGPTKAVTKTATDAGISVGTGSTAATEDDWQLENTLTTGINITLTETAYGNDAPGIPYVQYKITVTNTGSEPITVKEIGYKQTVGSVKYPGATTDTNTKVFLLDRTVLDTPVTIAAGDAGIITYKLRTIPRLYDTVEGVQMVSFADGTDEQIAAILDAAAAGTINLQTDAGWRVGDKRKISLSAFTGGNNVTCPAQDVYIAISSFEEYMGCGNVMQFDFACCTSAQFRMNSGATTGGYAASEMKNTTLPALVEALPAWLKSRLKTFSVLAGNGGGGSSSQTVETVTGNKLALRSEVEVFGRNLSSPAGEGEQVEYYKTPDAGRIKTQGVAGSAALWWERSVYSSSNFCIVNAYGSAYSGGTASNTYGLAPFGCI
jgi:hypothetical protein